jgi:hypothetical protein
MIHRVKKEQEGMKTGQGIYYSYAERFKSSSRGTTVYPLLFKYWRRSVTTGTDSGTMS